MFLNFENSVSTTSFTGVGRWISRLTRVSLISSITVGIAACQAMANPESIDASASQSAADLDASLAMNCTAAAKMELELFYTIINGEQVPVDCFSLLSISGDNQPDATGFGDPTLLKQVETRVNEDFVDQRRNPASTQIPLIHIEL